MWFCAVLKVVLDKSSFEVDLPVLGEKKNKMATRARKNIFLRKLEAVAVQPLAVVAVCF